MKTCISRQTKIKICGLTKPDQAFSCVKMGADLIGLNCWNGSSRYIVPEIIKEIVSELPESAKTVGIFVNESPDSINDIMKQTGMDWVQLHGDEAVDTCEKLEFPWFKAFRVSAKFKMSLIKLYKQEKFLIDAYSKYHFGGSGEKINIDLACKASGLGKMILAGGLTPDNVEEAIKKVNPWAVDVCSGVESKPGIKDMKLVEKFINKIIK
tara:strand:- start:2571 stop:3200 length:630 start_codon:yes stop_codon:yes gene_type:complete